MKPLHQRLQCNQRATILGMLHLHLLWSSTAHHCQFAQLPRQWPPVSALIMVMLLIICRNFNLRDSRAVSLQSWSTGILGWMFEVFREKQLNKLCGNTQRLLEHWMALPIAKITFKSLLSSMKQESNDTIANFSESKAKSETKVEIEYL